MTRPNELVAIFDRIRDGIQDERDISLLGQWLKNSNDQNVLQVGKNIINITDGKDIHVGDRTYYNTDAESIKAVIREVLTELIHSVNLEKFPQQNSLPANFLPQTTNKDVVTTINSQTQQHLPIS
jgi:Effector-associated domain 10